MAKSNEKQIKNLQFDNIYQVKRQTAHEKSFHEECFQIDEHSKQVQLLEG